MPKRKTKKKLREETLKQVKLLFMEAGIAFKNKNIKSANDYVRKARKLGMKVNLTLPREIKRKFCKHCHSYLMPGNNCRVRMHKSRVIYYCFNCKKYMRFVKKKFQLKIKNK